MYIFILTISFMFMILSNMFNHDTYIMNTYMTIVILLTLFLIKNKYQKLYILHPIFIFNIVFWLIFISGSLIKDLTNPNLNSLLIFFIVFFNIGFLFYFILFSNINSKQVYKVVYSKKVYNLYIFFSLLFGVLFLLYYYYIFGVPMLSSNINDARTIGNKGGISPIFSIVSYNAYIAMYLFITSNINKRIFHVYKIWNINYFLFFIYFIMVVLLANRTAFYYIFIPSFFYYIYAKRNISLKKIFLLIFSFVLVISITGALRNTSEINNIFIPMFKEIAAIQFNLFHVYNYFQDSHELYYGEMHLKGLAVMLPGHQVDMSLFLKDKLGINFEGGGLTPTIIGQIYIDFGIYGIIIESFILGMIFSLLYDTFLLKTKKIYHIYIYMYILAYIPYIIRNGILYSYSILFALFFLIIYRFFYFKAQKNHVI